VVPAPSFLASACSVAGRKPLAFGASGRNSLLKKICDRLQQWAVGNVTVRPMHAKGLVASDLVNNNAHGVRWNDATTVLQELGCNPFLKMPPGHTLSDLARENHCCINSIPAEAGVLPSLARGAARGGQHMRASLASKKVRVVWQRHWLVANLLA
jgi:acyl transferase domain-containing protein